MSWTDGKPFTVTDEMTRVYWGGGPGGKLACRLCGHIFRSGEVARFVFVNYTGSRCHFGNFHVCVDCDSPDVVARAADDEEAYRDAQRRFGDLPPSKDHR